MSDEQRSNLSDLKLDPPNTNSAKRPILALIITLLSALAVVYTTETLANKFVPPPTRAENDMFLLDANVGWRFLRNQRYPRIEWFDKEVDGDFITNNRGLKGSRDYPTPKDDNEFRVLCLGDSTANMVYFDGYPEFLEDLLSECLPELDVWVMNAGVNGFSSLNARFMARTEIPDFEPDVVVVTVGTDDAMRAEAPDSRDYEVQNFGQFVARVSQHSRFIGYARGLIPEGLTQTYQTDRQTMQGTMSKEEMGTRTAPDQINENMKVIVSLARRAKALPILTLQPWLFWDKQAYLPGTVHDPLTPWTLEIYNTARELQVPYVDAIELFDRPDRAAFFMVHPDPTNEEFGLVMDPIHLNAPGNQLLAAAYAEKILDHLAEKRPEVKTNRDPIASIRSKYESTPEPTEAYHNGVPPRDFYEHVTKQMKELNKGFNPRPWLEND